MRCNSPDRNGSVDDCSMSCDVVSVLTIQLAFGDGGWGTPIMLTTSTANFNVRL